MLSLSKHILYRIASCFAMTLLLVSCAQIVPLTGGKKDVDPPKEVESIPKNGSIFFAEKSITIRFNEFVKLNNLSSQLIVSPLMETPPEVALKGKKLVIKIIDELKPNTTYSINFGSSIVDITESNAIPNFKYVFSTGSYIDSLSYEGVVIDAFDLSKKDKIYTLLYDQLEDSVPYKELPRYIAISDKDGKFSITNIAQGTYKFFALNDINSNYLFDLPNEEIGFKEDVIQLDSSSSKNIVRLFEEDVASQYVKSAENNSYGKVDILFNLPTKNLSITPLNQFYKTKFYIEEKNVKGDSLTLWLTTTEGMETLDLLFKDSTAIIDTASIDISPRSEFEDSTVLLTTNITQSFDLNKSILLTTNRPIVEKKSENIQLFEDSVLVPFELESLNNNSRKYKIDYPFKAGKSYRFFIPPATFTDIYNLKNDSLNLVFKTKKQADYGIIHLKVNPNFSEHYIVQLYSNETLVRERYLKATNKVDFNYLLPGNYSIKLIIDANNDQQWNTGNYLQHLQPEKIIKYDKNVKIRANWDNDISWVIKE